MNIYFLIFKCLRSYKPGTIQNKLKIVYTGYQQTHKEESDI